MYTERLQSRNEADIIYQKVAPNERRDKFFKITVPEYLELIKDNPDKIKLERVLNEIKLHWYGYDSAKELYDACKEKLEEYKEARATCKCGACYDDERLYGHIMQRLICESKLKLFAV